MRIEELKGNVDGSTDYVILDMTEEETTAFVRLGIVKALEDAIEDAKKYDPNLVVEVKEPVVWVLPDGEIVVRPDYGGKIYYSEQSVYNDVATPKQKEWVGLTDGEAQWLYDNCRTHSNLIDMVEAKLKLKNT